MEGLPNITGMDWGTIAGVGGSVIILTNYVKKMFNLAGNANAIVAILLSIGGTAFVQLGVWNVLMGSGFGKILIGGILTYAYASGGWETIKTVLHKVSNNK